MRMKPFTISDFLVILGLCIFFGLIVLALSPDPSSNPISAQRHKSRQYMTEIIKGMQNYHDEQRSLPFLQRAPESEKTPVHSWMTLLLPYVERKPLYDQIQLDKTWNDPVNSDAFQTCVGTYWYLPSGYGELKTAEGFGASHYSANQLMFGKFYKNRPICVRDFIDGTSYTIMGGEIIENCPAWGDPTNWRDVTLGINKSPDGFGSPDIGGAQMMFLDGTVRYIAEDIDPEILNALSTPAGGEDLTGVKY